MHLRRAQNQPQQCAPTWSCALSSSSERDEQVSPPDRTAGHDVRPATGIPVVAYTIQPRMPLHAGRFGPVLRWLFQPATYAPPPIRARPHAAVLSSRPHPRRNIFPANVRERRPEPRQTDAGGGQAAAKRGARRSAAALAVPARVSGRRKPPARDPGCHSRSDLGVHKALQCSPSVRS